MKGIVASASRERNSTVMESLLHILVAGARITETEAPEQFSSGTRKQHISSNFAIEHRVGLSFSVEGGG
jgi:hypothetical protein